MGDDLVREVDGDIGHILEAVQMALAGGGHGFRLRRRQVIHDRKVVRRQVPDDIHVVLEQSQVHPGRIVVVELAQVPSSINCRIFRTAPVNRNV